MHCNNLRLVLGLGLVRVSSRARVKITVKVRVSVMVNVIFRPYGRKSSVIIRYFPSAKILFL